jgi:hypothetical protein
MRLGAPVKVSCAAGRRRAAAADYAVMSKLVRVLTV